MIETTESHAKVSGDIEPDDSVETRLEKLEALLALSTEQPQTVAPLFAELLSIARQIAVRKSLVNYDPVSRGISIGWPQF